MLDCVFTGDVMPGALRIDEPMPEVIPDRLASADIVVGNLESPLVSGIPAQRNQEKIPLWSTAENIAILNSFHFSHLCINNNHIYDLFDRGLDETASLLNGAGIGAFGLNHNSLSQYTIVESKGIRLGMIAFNWVQAQYGGHLFKEATEIDFTQARASVDFLICFLHWGDDHNLFVNEDQQTSARSLIDQGADLVMGSHPHVPQGWEVYHDKHIFYSLGNFIFTPKETYDELPYHIRYDDHRENVLFQREECKIGLYVKIRFAKQRYHLIGVEPTYRRHTLPGPLPENLYGFFEEMLQRMNTQVQQSDYRLNEEYKKMILKKYTLPLILKNPNYWPIFLKKLSLKKVFNFISN